MTHVWQGTGVTRSSHANIGLTAYAHYVRCASCGQTGYRKRSRVIYTWRFAEVAGSRCDQVPDTENEVEARCPT